MKNVWLISSFIGVLIYAIHPNTDALIITSLSMIFYRIECLDDKLTNTK